MYISTTGYMWHECPHRQNAPDVRSPLVSGDRGHLAVMVGQLTNRTPTANYFVKETGTLQFEKSDLDIAIQFIIFK